MRDRNRVPKLNYKIINRPGFYRRLKFVRGAHRFNLIKIGKI